MESGKQPAEVGEETPTVFGRRSWGGSGLAASESIPTSPPRRTERQSPRAFRRVVRGYAESDAARDDAKDSMRGLAKPTRGSPGEYVNRESAGVRTRLSGGVRSQRARGKRTQSPRVSV